MASPVSGRRQALPSLPQAATGCGIWRVWPTGWFAVSQWSVLPRWSILHRLTSIVGALWQDQIEPLTHKETELIGSWTHENSIRHRKLAKDCVRLGAARHGGWRPSIIAMCAGVVESR